MIPVIVTVVIIAAIILYSYYSARKERIKRERKEEEKRIYLAVGESSPLIADIHELALMYPVNWRVQATYHKHFNVYSKQAFDIFNFEKRILDWMESNYQLCSDLIATLNANRVNWNQFYYSIPDDFDYVVPDEFLEEIGIDEERFHEEEKRIVDDLKNQSPVTDVDFYFDLLYETPKGKSSYKKSECLTLIDLEQYLAKVDQIIERRQSAQYQRQLMTAKLRYEVLQRDNFRCVICGRAEADGVKLHVDHIKPVSKGGKTVLDNLRTLCQDCNLGKGDSYNPDGIN